MEKNEELYSLIELRNKVPEKEYDEIVDELAHKVMEFYELQSHINEDNINKTIQELEEDNSKDKIKELVIEKMKNIRFTIENNLLSASIDIKTIDEDIKYSRSISIKEEQEKRIRRHDSKKIENAIIEVNSMLKSLEDNGEVEK